MHPILARARRLLVFLLLFAQAGVLLAEILVRTVGIARGTAWLLAVPVVEIHAFVCLASWYLCRRQPLTQGRWRRALGNQAAAGLVGVAVVLALAVAWARTLDAARTGLDVTAVVLGHATLLGVYGFLLYSLAAAGHYLYLALEDRRRIAERAIELRLLAREAELRALKAQLDPHFLFNSLNAINALVGRAPERARAMCSGLADFLRLSLRHAQAEAITVADEIATVDHFLAIERIRFGDRLVVARDIDESCLDAAVPPLILQPLVENALEHGIAHCVRGGTLRLVVAAAAGDVELTVENPVDPDRPRSGGEGFGLGNVRRRLRVRYGPEAQLVAGPTENGFRAYIRVPRRGRTERSGARGAISEAPTDRDFAARA